MPMIPEDEIERIKREADLAAVIRTRGVELKPAGHDLVGLCPFHADHDPSLRVTPGKGLWRCMSCGATGNVIQFVQKFDGVSFRHAFELLKSGKLAAVLSGPATGAPVKKSSVPRLDSPLAPDAAGSASSPQADQAALRQVLGYYHERLPQNPAALAYLQKRGINHEEAIAAFQIGFVDRTLGLRLPNNQRKDGAAIREQLTRLGLLRSTGHEHLRGRIVFPIPALPPGSPSDLSAKASATAEAWAKAGPDDFTQIGTVYGRAIDEKNKHDRHLFLPGPQRGIWNPAALKSPEVIITEGIIDALTFWCAGFRHVTTAFSAKALPEELLAALLAARVQRVFLAFDRDPAGDKGAEEAAAQLMARGVECRRVLFPHGQDANDYARQVQPPAKSLGVLLNAAAWMGRGQGKGSALATPGRGAAPAPVDAATLRVPAPSSLAAKAASGAASSFAEPTADRPVVPAPEVTTEPKAEAAKEESMTPALPVAPSSSPAAAGLLQQGEHWFLTLDGPSTPLGTGREYRIGGLEKTLGTDGLKIALRLKTGDRFHLDCLDLARDADRRRFIERAAEETGLHADLLKRDLGRLLLAVEQAQGELARPKETASPVCVLSAAERIEALAWLQAPDLIGRLRAAIRHAGIIGEENNALVAYLAGVSRKLDRPLAIIVQSASAAGKTTLMDAVLSFFPEEERVKYSAMTGQSLYYLGETNLKHKILAIVEEAGAEKASYALKLLQSEGELTIASTGKDPQTGRMETQEYRVEGPVMIMLTTTAIDLDEELQNRCLTLAVDESPEQTARIHTLQRERRTLAGIVAKAERTELLRVLKNAQRLLAPVEVLNPFAPKLTFPAQRTRNRRDHEKYLTLIDAIALLHQHQRPHGRQEMAGRVLEYVEATLEDIALANELAPEVLGRSLDELPPQTRTVLDHVRALIRAKRGATVPLPPLHVFTFSRRELHERCGWSFTQLRVHLDRLVEQEYLAVRCGRMGSQFVYELLIDADAPANAAHVPLLDVARLRETHRYDSNLAGKTGLLAGGDAGGPRGIRCA